MSKTHVYKDLFWLITDKVFILVIGLLVTVKIANHYGSSTYGIYEYAASIITVISIILTFVDGRIVKKLYEKSDNINQSIIYNTNIAKLLLVLITSLVSVLTLIFIKDDRDFSLIFLLLLLNTILLNLSFGYQNYFEFKLKSKIIVIASNISLLLASILQLVAIEYNYSIVIIVLLMVIASLIRCAIILIQFKYVFKLNLLSKIDKSLIKSIIINSIPLAIAAAASIAYHRIDQVMIGSMLTNMDVGIYGISNKMITIISMIIVPIQTTLFPKMLEWFKTNPKHYYARYIQITSTMIWMYIVGVIATYTFGEYVFRMVFSADYYDSFKVFKLHVFGSLFSYIAILRSSHYTIISSTSIMTKTQITALLLNVIMNFFMIPIYGIYGAAISTVITQGLSLLFLDLIFTDGRLLFKLEIKSLNPLIAISFIKIEFKHLLDIISKKMSNF